VVLRSAAPARLEMDLSALTFPDSSGLRCLLDCRRRVETAGSRLVLVEPSQCVVGILTITGMAGEFGVRAAPVPSAARGHRVWSRTDTA
jgi:anti-anti-sigma factor